MAVVDASLYVALVNAREPDHARSWAWFEAAQRVGEPVRAPAILLCEVASALSRGLGAPELVRRAVVQLRQSRAVELVPVTVVLAEKAATLAAQHRIRGCDAVYVALAQQLGEPLLTLDAQQRARGAAAADVREP